MTNFLLQNVDKKGFVGNHYLYMCQNENLNDVCLITRKLEGEQLIPNDIGISFDTINTFLLMVSKEIINLM